MSATLAWAWPSSLICHYPLLRTLSCCRMTFHTPRIRKRTCCVAARTNVVRSTRPIGGRSYGFKRSAAIVGFRNVLLVTLIAALLSGCVTGPDARVNLSLRSPVASQSTEASASVAADSPEVLEALAIVDERVRWHEFQIRERDWTASSKVIRWYSRSRPSRASCQVWLYSTHFGQIRFFLFI